MDGELFSTADLDQELIEKENRKKERERQALIKEKEEARKKKEEEEKSITLDKTLYLLDGYSIIYKSYYAFISRPLTDRNGNNISAYYGFFQTLFHMLKENRMDGLAITMDEKEPTFRHIMYPEYKANRDKAPDDLHKSVEPIKATLAKMKIPVLEERLRSRRCHGFRFEEGLRVRMEDSHRHRRQGSLSACKPLRFDTASP